MTVSHIALSKVAIRAALVSAVSLSSMVAGAAFAQDAVEVDTGVEDIIVTAQRQSQSLQDVPIAVSAFSAQALTEKQINNVSQLQLTLPNITFTKNNFTNSSFTIRGIGDLCVGGTCDTATGIATNELPLFGTRLFETEFLDLERVEVLRGPQGTLFGRNATAGVINLITAKPKLGELQARGEVGYGNYNEIRLQGMVNVPLGDAFAARVAGFYLKRDGYTENLYEAPGIDKRIDGRDMYAVRGSLRWEPGDDTTIDLMGYYFREDDNRLRIQKQQCQSDPTGVLGCLPGNRGNGVANYNSTFPGVLSSREFLTTQGGPGIGALGLGSIYGPDAFTGAQNPSDPRQVYTDTNPTYFADEIQAMARIEHDFGPLRAKLSGMYQRNEVESAQDYSLAVTNASGFATGLGTLQAYANGAGGAALRQFGTTLAALLPDGAAGGTYCTSQSDETGVGAFGGNAVCAGTPLDFDRSRQESETWTGELILTSQFDGRFNFLVGGIYSNNSAKDTDYYVNAFQVDYVAGVLGTLTALGQQGAGNTGFPNVYLATPFFRNATRDYTLKTYGIFGEAYFDLTDRIKVTAGLRYNNDTKSVVARSTLLAFPAPYGLTDIFDSPFAGGFDADPGIPGNQPFQEREVSSGEFTGRFVVDWRVTDDNLLYASYSRGYKSGGINPPLDPSLLVDEAFAPEFIDAFEIGSKNRFLDGTLQLNVTGFYYKYSGLQLARIVARTAVNDNIDATIWGVEVEGVVRPIPPLAINLGFSYLNTEVTSEKEFINARDPSGGRDDAVIVKDLAAAYNCVVTPSGPGGAALSNGYVAGVNAAINAGIPAAGIQPGAGLRGPTPFPTGSGLNPGVTGAFSFCDVLAASAAASGVTVTNVGIATSIKGNRLPQAPEYKVSVGVQYTLDLDNGMSIVPRWDLAFTGESFGNIFNGSINRIESYEVMNAQIQVNGKDDRWFLRGYIQNITDNNATTGLYLADQSVGTYTNIFTLEPRRFGVTAGFAF